MIRYYDNNLDEYTNPEQIEFMNTKGQLAHELLNYGLKVKDAKRCLEDGYQGIYANKIDFARELFIELHDVPDKLIPYIDYKQYAADIFTSLFFALEIRGKTHIFEVKT